MVESFGKDLGKIPINDGLIELKSFIQICVALQNIVRYLDRTEKGLEHKQKRQAFLRDGKETAFKSEIADYQEIKAGKMSHASKQLLRACEISDEQWTTIHRHFMGSAASRTLVEQAVRDDKNRREDTDSSVEVLNRDKAMDCLLWLEAVKRRELPQIAADAKAAKVTP
jgi:hypothetical protein